ncbi:MAG: hypothetical protein AAF269_02660 [Pseudomonadota bacterium]
MSKLITAIAASCALFAPVCAAAAPASFRFVGDWQGACDAWGVPATCTAIWRPGQHESHLVQDYSIVSNKDGTRIFSGRGLYRIIDGEVDGIWEDSRGQILPLGGSFEDDTLTVIWGDATSEIGRSVYRLQADGLAATDSVLTESGWRTFMSIDYARDD